MNKLTDRLEVILSAVPKCRCLADVGCDHGYVAKEALVRGIAERVVVSDVSAPSLKKAQRLLAPYGERVSSVVCDGLCKTHEACDAVLIAGMGGEEIISILDGAPFKPYGLVLQPMKNVDKVRKRLLVGGYRITGDRIFKAEGKFYNLITARLGEDGYTERELMLGRDNLKERGKDFLEFCRLEYNRYARLLEGDMPDLAREKLQTSKKILGELIDEDQ